MKITTFSDALAHCGIKTENHLLPFYWQHGDHHDKLAHQIEVIQSSGCNAFCVESRPHKDFCGDGWWKDMDVILAEAEKRGMQVWILDDNHFPTGNANYFIEKKYPDLRAWNFAETHVDVLGPAPESQIMIRQDWKESDLLGVYAYPRNEYGEAMLDKPIDLTPNITGSTIIWDIPEGLYRVFLIYKTRMGRRERNSNYIDMLNPKSVDVLLEACYEPHYQHYAKYFGNTLQGFFSDEPGFFTTWAFYVTEDLGGYNTRCGQPGQAMPYSDDAVRQLKETFGPQWLSRIPALWFPLGDATATIRHTYMDIVSRGYRDCFTRRVGDWCRSHGVQYIGHIIEDMNSNGRLGVSAGHYFRSQDGQDMSGMDIVLHQVIPGMGDYVHTASAFMNRTDSHFFQYTLPKMCSSAAHFDTRTKGRAMCEVFGAYGWAEGTPMMKWLMDFLLVRGVNQFVPHAFSPCYPDPDCPPHFGAEGHDPQFGAFTSLMHYTNAIASLLYPAQHVADVALLYQAEAEWLSLDDSERMLSGEPAYVLAKNHFDFDVVPIDALLTATVENGLLHIGSETFKALVLPGAKRLPANAVAKIKSLRQQGAVMFFVDQAPAELQDDIQTVSLVTLPHFLTSENCNEVSVVGSPVGSLLHYHVRRDGMEIYFIVNESVTESSAVMFNTPNKGDFLLLSPCNNTAYRATAPTGGVPLMLQPGESCVVIFGAKDIQDYPPRPTCIGMAEISAEYTVELAESDDLTAFKPYDKITRLYSITNASHLPDFCGYMRYTFKLKDIDTTKHLLLDLGEVGQTAQVSVNGKDLGWKYCKPYQFDLKGCIAEGENTVVVTVANTLAAKHRDWFSTYLQIPRSGLLGPCTLIELND